MKRKEIKNLLRIFKKNTDKIVEAGLLTEKEGKVRVEKKKEELESGNADKPK